MMFTEKEDRRIDLLVGSAAKKISAAMDTLVRSLPAGAAPQMAMERLAHQLVELKPSYMRWMMECEEVRARIPLSRLLESRANDKAFHRMVNDPSQAKALKRWLNAGLTSTQKKRLPKKR